MRLRIKNINLITLPLFLIITFCIIMLLSMCDKDKSVTSTKQQLEPGEYDLSVKVDTTTRWFKLIIPAAYDHSEARPLLISFHGGGLSMAFVVNNRQDMIDRCAQENWLLAIPNGSSLTDNRGSATWNAVHCCNPAFNHNADDIGFVQKLVDTLSSALNIDETRIYAMGGSNGGMLTHRMAAELPDIFAAVALSAGTIGGQPDSTWPEIIIQPTQPVPIMMTHGLNDPNVKYFGGKTQDANRIDISFKRSLQFWAANNQCTESMADTTTITGAKGRIWIVRYNDCTEDYEVRGVTIENHGHGWPGLEDAGWDGTNAMIDFLKRFSK